MDAASSPGGTCAATLAWLREKCGQVGGGAELIDRAWRNVRDAMRAAPGGQTIDERRWPSDHWIARAAERTFIGTVVHVWDPPEKLDEWPTFDTHPPPTTGGVRVQHTNHQAFRETNEGVRPLPSDGSSRWLRRIEDMANEAGPIGDVRRVQIGHVWAWLDTALGSMFMDVATSEADDNSLLTAFARTRLGQARRIEPFGLAVMNSFEDRRLDAIYNTRIGGEVPGRMDAQYETRTGQGARWNEHWGHLSHTVGARHTVEALEVAAGLLSCAPLLDALVEAVGSSDAVLSRIALAVLRRWMLSLKVMAWLEVALTRQWADVRSEDLACFAFAAMRPHWPRRHLAISHRSKDAKPRLLGMAAWESASCAIDATHVPAWETNTGMVWGLFASVPAISRVRSANYEESEWCRREIEIAQYLIDGSDFMAGRFVMDVPIADIEVLDAFTVEPVSPRTEKRRGRRRARRPSHVLPQFPPVSQLWRVPEIPAWEADMMRAGAALRLLNGVSPNPDAANRLAELLMVVGDASPFGQPPVATPGGWRDYARILRKAASLAPSRPALPMWLPSHYAEQALDRRRFDVMRRLRATPAFEDVLLAIEWRRVEWPWMVQRGLGDLLLVDCEGVPREAWETQPSYALMRGLVAMPDLPVPLWVLQSATQQVERWSFFAEDRPIFTRHDRRQFLWMMVDNVVDRTEAQRRYPELSGLALCSDLKARCGWPTS